MELLLARLGGLVFDTFLWISLVMMATWLVAEFRLKNAGLVDVIWGTAFFPPLLWYWLNTPDGLFERKLLLVLLFGLAYGRLFIYLIRRFLRQFPVEDARYHSLRVLWDSENKPTAWLMLGVFFLQAGLIVLLSAPMAWIMLNPSPQLHWVEWLGLCVGLVAVVFESVADWQLTQFLANSNNQGKVCKTGLWRYSRHPNHFGQWLIWVALWLIACGAPFGWLSLFAPAVMLHFLLNITGVHPTEQQTVRSRGEAYRQYQRETSAFVPWFPKVVTD